MYLHWSKYICKYTWKYTCTTYANIFVNTLMYFLVYLHWSKYIHLHTNQKCIMTNTGFGFCILYTTKEKRVNSFLTWWLFMAHRAREDAIHLKTLTLFSVAWNRSTANNMIFGFVEILTSLMWTGWTLILGVFFMIWHECSLTFGVSFRIWRLVIIDYWLYVFSITWIWHQW